MRKLIDPIPRAEFDQQRFLEDFMTWAKDHYGVNSGGWGAMRRMCADLNLAPTTISCARRGVKLLPVNYMLVMALHSNLDPTSYLLWPKKEPQDGSEDVRCPSRGDDLVDQGTAFGERW